MFRRHFLLQLRILFQCLTSPTHRQMNFILSPSRRKILAESQERVEKLLIATPPHGSKFAKEIENLLSREMSWVQWKNTTPTACPPIQVEPSNLSIPLKVEISTSSHKKKKHTPPVLMGDAELNRLWALPDNETALKEYDSVCLPDLSLKLQDILSEEVENRENKEKKAKGEEIMFETPEDEMYR